MLEDKNAVIYGAEERWVVRSPVPSSARWPKVFLSGRTLESPEEVAEETAPSNKQWQ